MRMTMRMPMLIAAAEEPGGGDVHDKSGGGDQDRLVEMDRHRREETQCRLVANEQGNYRKDDGARKSGEIAELSSAENKAGIVGVPPRISIGQGSDQERQGVGCHMKAVGDHAERSKQSAAGDFRDHHESRERNRRPRPTLVGRMAGAKIDMAVFA